MPSAISKQKQQISQPATDSDVWIIIPRGKGMHTRTKLRNHVSSFSIVLFGQICMGRAPTAVAEKKGGIAIPLYRISELARRAVRLASGERCREQRLCCCPVDNVPPSVDVVRTPVLISEVIRLHQGSCGRLQLETQTETQPRTCSPAAVKEKGGWALL